MTDPDTDALVQRLVAIEEIKQLKARYFRTMDQKACDEFGQVFARGTWAMFDFVEWPATDGGDRVGLQGYGHYIEEYVREDGQWRIARSRLVRFRVDGLSAARPELDV